MAESENEPNRIKVILRIRPANKQEITWFNTKEYSPIIRSAFRTERPDTRIIIDYSGKSYDYDKVFRDDCQQKAIFREAALPTLENVFRGYCGAVMAYGQTGTGKTHTMQGYDREPEGNERGIIPRCAEYIFNRISQEKDYKTKVTLSFIQIYLDKLQDLFDLDATEMQINPDSERVEIPGVQEREVRNTTEFMKNYYEGESHRVTRATLMNPTSSRGHAALIVSVKMVPQDAEGLKPTKCGKLVLVDLAGYERYSLTGVTTGIAAEEAKKINASLLALGSVVNALAERQKHVPYRNSKLTRLLKDCLGGNSKSTIVLTVGPCDKYRQETAGTLYFGWRAMAVKVDARIKEEFDPTRYIQNLVDRIGLLEVCVKGMAKHIKGIGSEHWKSYIATYGNPPVQIDDEDEEEERGLKRFQSSRVSFRYPSTRNLKPAEVLQDEEHEQIVCALTKTESRRQPIQSQPSLVGMTAEKLLRTENPAPVSVNLPAPVKKVQDEWESALLANQEQVEHELKILQLRHLQDLEEAREAGFDEEAMRRLREQHEEELQLLRENNELFKAELMRQKQQEEAQVLLSSALQGCHHNKQDQHRITEMVSHLSQTCASKDEVVIRLFELVCLREEEANDLSINAMAIAQAEREDLIEGKDKALTVAHREVSELRLQNERLREELRRAKLGILAPGQPVLASPANQPVIMQTSPPGVRTNTSPNFPRSQTTVPTSTQKLMMQSTGMHRPQPSPAVVPARGPAPSVVPTNATPRASISPTTHVVPTTATPRTVPVQAQVIPNRGPTTFGNPGAAGYSPPQASPNPNARRHSYSYYAG